MTPPKLQPYGIITMTLQEIHKATGGPTDTEDRWQYGSAEDGSMALLKTTALVLCPISQTNDLVLHVIQL